MRILILAALAATGLLIPPSPAAPPSAPGPSATPAAASTNDVPGAVDYAKLDWKDDVFYLEGKAFTGTSVQRQKKTGALKCRYEFVDGRIHGLVEEWWPNGQRSTETHFAKGTRHGTNTYWDADGKQIKQQIWKDGVLVQSSDPHELENR